MAKKKEKETAASVEDTDTEMNDETIEQNEAEQQESEEDPLLIALTEAANNRDLYLRALADLDNYRKRALREKEDAIRFANDTLLRNIIPVLDNLERAIEHARTAVDDQGRLLEGVELTLDQFYKVLEAAGVTPIDAMGQPFDPNFHQAMGQIPTGDQPANMVIQELQKGYILNSRLLRPSMVMVTTLPEVTTSESTTEGQDEALPDTDE